MIALKSVSLSHGLRAGNSCNGRCFLPVLTKELDCAHLQALDLQNSNATRHKFEARAMGSTAAGTHRGLGSAKPVAFAFPPIIFFVVEIN